MDDVETSPTITNKQAVMELYNRCVVKLGCVYLLNGWEAQIWDEVNVLMSYYNTNAELDTDTCECQFDETTFTAGYSKGIIFTKKIAEAKNFGEGLYYVRWLAGCIKRIKDTPSGTLSIRGWRAYAKFGTFYNIAALLYVQ